MSIPSPPGGGQKTLSVVVPVHNERFLVEEALRRILAVEIPGFAIDVVAVDDGSTDGSRERIRRMAAQEPRLRLLEHERNRGKGAALRTAIAAAEGDLIVFQDADLEYDPRDLAVLVRPFVEDGADVVYGSRFLPGARRRVLGFRHTLVNRTLTSLSNLFTDLDLTDMETCYKMFRAPLLKSIPIRSNGFAIEPEITAKVAKRQSRIFEVPISYVGRTRGEGKKIGWTDGIAAVAAILRYWIVDDVYAEDEYGSHILHSLERVRRFNRWMAESVAPHVGDRVLEIGAGIGNIARWLMPRDSYVASDINPHYLRYLENLAIGRPYLEVARVDLEDAADFEGFAGRFDTVVCLNVLEHVGDPLRALANIHRALAPGGRAVIYVPRGPRLYSKLDEVLGHRCRYTQEALRRELEASGFELASCRTFNRTGVPGWWWNGKVLRRRSFSRLQLGALNAAMPLVRRLDRFLPWPGLGILAVAARR